MLRRAGEAAGKSRRPGRRPGLPLYRYLTVSSITSGIKRPHRRQSTCFEDLDGRLIVIGTHADGITASPVRKAGGRSIVRRRYAGALQQSAHALGVGDGAAEQKIIWQCQRLPYEHCMLLPSKGVSTLPDNLPPLFLSHKQRERPPPSGGGRSLCFDLLHTLSMSPTNGNMVALNSRGPPEGLPHGPPCLLRYQ